MGKIKHELQKNLRRFIAVICVLSVFGSTIPEEVKANTVFTNAYMYYNIAGSVMVFIPGADGQGEIYYATKAKKATSSGILYTTLGWQVVVHNVYGTPVEAIYYQMGGSNMVLVNSVDVDGYEYCLYKMSFANLKARLTPASVQTLNTANSYLTFNACTAVKINGVVQGAMTDAGPLWGVYTTYDGIANAQNWSAETRVTLQSYYNKYVSGLFFNVSANRGTGIASVSGDGSYCYGAPVTLTATPARGYQFSHWTGDATRREQSFTFTMTNINASYTAVAVPLTLNVIFIGENLEQSVSQRKEYVYDRGGQKLLNFNWKKEGYHQTGWNTKENGTGEQYQLQQQVANDWILVKRPQINLYATWEMNRYQFIYDYSGGKGELAPETVKFSDTMQVPEAGVEKERATLIGWSTKKDATEPEFTCGQDVSVAEIAKSLNLQYQHNAKVTLYAVWDYAPEITGENIYVSLEDAKNGAVTEEWLSKFLKVEDVEDGEIFYGIHEKNSFLVTNYLTTDFTTFQKDGSVTENFRAIDSVGNVTEKQIAVHIIDTSIYDIEEITGTPRFISASYYKEDGRFVDEKEGGLWKESVWKRNSNFTNILDEVLQE